VIPIVGLGAGGHAKVMIETIRAMGGFDIVGLLDPDAARKGGTVLGISVLGDDSRLDELGSRGIRHAFVGVGSVGPTALRRGLFEMLRVKGIEIVSVIHPSALVSPSAQVGSGVAIMAGAIINANATLGDNVLVNTGAIVEHDCVIGSHVHLATGAKLGGAVTIGDGSHIGIGASIRQGLRIGVNVVVGAGAAVVADAGEGLVLAGVPARAVRKNEPGEVYG
jgi:UDP-perosamine 4-acetyltransferase